jgi:preprotein translocase subunit SecA
VRDFFKKVFRYFKETPQDFKKEIIALKDLTGICLDFNIKKVPKIISLELLYSELWLSFELRSLADENFYDQSFEKSSLLEAMDICWSEHLEKMSELREATRWQAYAQKDPFIIYKQEAMRMFLNISSEVIDILILDRLISDIL